MAGRVGRARNAAKTRARVAPSTFDSNQRGTLYRLSIIVFLDTVTGRLRMVADGRDHAADSEGFSSPEP